MYMFSFATFRTRKKEKKIDEDDETVEKRESNDMFTFERGDSENQGLRG